MGELWRAWLSRERLGASKKMILPCLRLWLEGDSVLGPLWKLMPHGDLVISILGQISHSKNLARSSLKPVIFYRCEKYPTIDMSYHLGRGRVECPRLLNHLV